MTNSICPVETPAYKYLKELYGEDGAYAIWKLSDGGNPEAVQAFKTLYPNAEIEKGLQAWDTGTFSGKPQKEYEKQIDEIIINDPNAKVGGGESFNQVKQRSLRTGMSILDKAPYGSVVVTHSSILKFIMLWDNEGRPSDWGKITPQMYLDMSTTPGEVVTLHGTNGKVFFVRHGETWDNENSKLRTPETTLTDDGKEEADKVGDKLGKELIPQTYVSPFPRTLQTADRILVKQLPLQFENKSNINYQKTPLLPNQIDSQVKIINTLLNPKAEQLFNKFLKTNPDKFYSELQQLGSNKQQVELLKNWINENKPKTLNEAITGFAADMSYTVEVNVGKEYRAIDKGFHNYEDGWQPENEENTNLLHSSNSSYYSNLTVPGGTNYTENEIAIPGITPSIKGHAAFSTDNGIGWFRSDEKRGETINTYPLEFDGGDSLWKKENSIWYQKIKGDSDWEKRDDLNDDEVYAIYDNKYGVKNYQVPTIPTKTRRVLEIQSDLFQKGRNSSTLVQEKQVGRTGIIDKNADNFLQLLNKDGNWIPFFIKSIVQDSTKKGYESVLFPAGETAAKIEGHETLANEINRLDEAINNPEKFLHKTDPSKGYAIITGGANVFGSTKEEFVEKVKAEKQELKAQGVEKLKPIEGFYEVRIKNTLDKIYGKNNIERITDEHGNDWFQLKTDKSRDLSTIFFQKLDNNKKLRYELQSVLNRAISQGRSGSTIETAASIFDKDENADTEGAGTVSQTEKYWRDIQQNGLEYNGELGEQIGKGGEHRVYPDEDGKHVIKVNYSYDKPKELQGYLNELLIYNHLFPETAYKLLGFIREGDKINPVVRQPFIDEDSDIYDRKAIQETLSKLGFDKIEQTIYKNPYLGITISDVNARNVLFKEGIPYFVDPQITYTGKLFVPKEPNPIKSTPDAKLEQVIKGFLSSIGVNVKHIADTGQGFAGMADTINGIIKVVNGKAGIDTLPHEATHMFLDLLPDNSKLLDDILKQVRTTETYDDIYNQYKGDSQYKNADGTVNEEKIAKEAAAHIIDDIIVDKFKDKQALKWWQRLWNWIKNLFEGKKLSDYEQVAEDILGNKTTKLSKEKIAKMKEANERGEIYYELSDKDKERVENIRNKATTTDIQKAIIDNIYLKPNKLDKRIIDITNEQGIKPHDRVVLDESTHTYSDLKGNIYESTTKRINGEFSPEKAAKFEGNAKVGSEIDSLLQAAILGKSHKNISDIVTPSIPDEIKTDLFSKMRQIVADNTESGEVALTQVIVTDQDSKVAGSIDLMLIHPTGHVRIIDLKSSINDTFSGKSLSGTYTSTWGQNEGSVFKDLTFDEDANIVPKTSPEQKSIELSKEMQHAIQTGSYAKMLELQGIPVTSIQSYHIKVDISDKGNGNYELKSWKDEGFVDHSIQNNQPYIDQVVPSVIDEMNPSKLQKNRPGYDYQSFDLNTAIPTQEDIERRKEFNNALDNDPKATLTAKEIVNVVDQRIAYLKRLNTIKQDPTVKEATIWMLQEMKQEMMRALDKNKASQVLNSWMDFTINQSTIISKYLSDPTKLSDENFTAIAEQARKFAESYAYINGIIDKVHSTQIDKFNQAVGAVNELRKINDQSTIDWFRSFAANTDSKYLDEEIETYINGNPRDISAITRLVGPSTNTRSIPLSFAASEIQKSQMAAFEFWDSFRDEFKPISDNFLKALGKSKSGNDIFDFMLHDNGTYVRRVGNRYWDLLKATKNDTLDTNGERLKYQEGTSPEAIEYNKDLKKKFDRLSELTRAEYYDKKVKAIVDGEYSEYVPVPIYDDNGNITGYNDFEQEREKFEYKDKYGRWQMLYNPDVVSGLKWIKVEDGKYYRENVDGTRGELLSQSDINNLNALVYRNKFKRPIFDTPNLVYDKDGEFTGIVNGTKDEPVWTVKREYIQPRDKSTTGVDLRDSRYVALQNDQSEIGKARKEFYDGYMSMLNKLLLKLPAEQRENFKGKIPVQEMTLAHKLMDKDVPLTKVQIIKRQASKSINNTYIGERFVNEAGEIEHSIPIGYTTSLRDQEKIDKIKVQIEKLDADWNNHKALATKEQKYKYENQRKVLADTLKTEELRAQPYEINRDLIQLMNDFSHKVATYNADSAIESTVLMIKNMSRIKNDNAEMMKTDADGRPLFKKIIGNIGNQLKILSGGDSNELKRIDDLITMIMYKVDESGNSLLGKFESLAMSLTALNAFVINPPTSFGVSASINSTHLREAAVGDFFKMKQLAKAKQEIAKAVKGYIQNEAIKTAKGKAKKYGSKPEAWAAEVQAFTKGISDDITGFKHLLSLEHFVEWEGVITGGIAIGLNTKVVGKDGTISNAYDIYDWQPDGTVKVQDNFKDNWTKTSKQNLNRRLADYQVYSHGLYAPVEKMVISKYPGGRSIAMLHKFMFSAISSRMGPRITTMQMGPREGSYVTLYHIVKDITKFQGNIMEKFQQGFQSFAPKGSIGNDMWAKMNEQEREQADNKAYENDPEFKDKDGNTDWKKVERDRDIRKMELTNLKRVLFDAVYICVAFAAVQLLRSLAEDTEDENTKRWAYFIARTFDKLRRQQMFAIPLVGISEQYSILKSPIASLRTLGEFADAFTASAGLVIPPYEDNYYTNGVHAGELKAKVAWEKVLPGLNVIEWV